MQPIAFLLVLEHYIIVLYIRLQIYFNIPDIKIFSKAQCLTDLLSSHGSLLNIFPWLNMQTFFFNFFFACFLLVGTLSHSLLCNLDDKIFLCSANKACRAQEQGTKSEIRRRFIHATRYYIYIHIYLYSCLAINISACHERTNEPETKGIKNP